MLYKQKNHFIIDWLLKTKRETIMNRISTFLIVCLITTAYNHAKVPTYKDVYFQEPTFVVIDPDVMIGEGTTIGCGVHILGRSTIGKNCFIGPFSVITNCTIGDNVKIYSHCVIENSTFASHTEIGPFAHISEKSTIQEKVIIGNFVEVKRSNVGTNSKAKHLSYIGDGVLGSHVNIGGGTIFCNYNGVLKQQTTILDNASIGGNNSLVAPLIIGKGAITGAGSTITENVPDNCLAIGRVNKQINKENYASKLLEKYKQEKASKERQEHKE